MNELPYLNLGCGMHFDPQWINVDFSKSGEGVIAHNLLHGIPFKDDTFEVVYHSHVLEHFPKDRASEFIKECYRVLKPGGVIRVAVPDLEQIVNNYCRLLAKGKLNPDDEKIRADYEWIMIELFDQTVRNQGGGDMLKYLSKEVLANEDFIYRRIGYEGRALRQNMIKSAEEKPPQKLTLKRLYFKLRWEMLPESFKAFMLKLFFKKEYELIQLSRFRQSGEIHQWMYDIYSLGNLLKSAGFKDVEKKSFNESAIPGWRSFSLDEVDHKIRKPDSLFAEAIK